jgi:hypothetical protein
MWKTEKGLMMLQQKARCMLHRVTHEMHPAVPAMHVLK